MEVCDDGEHTCFHGSKCIDNYSDDSGGAFICDCEVGFTEFDKFAGLYCEHNITSDCSVNQTVNNETSLYSFCVNDGKCEITSFDIFTKYSVCQCSDAWTG